MHLVDAVTKIVIIVISFAFYLKKKKPTTQSPNSILLQRWKACEYQLLPAPSEEMSEKSIWENRKERYSLQSTHTPIQT